ncbi:MAG TPA: hypothetical protein VMZ53_21950 [Kofleriaceae bacterium]|nr:hypothetical protein [Kofleriaceae bacterium]
MRLLCAALLLTAAACTDDSDPDVRVERQVATLDDASAAAWSQGGAVLVGVPGTFAFPQPLSLRISIVDNKQLDEEMSPTQLKITSATLATYGDASELTVKTQPSCAANFCSAELEVSAQGASMLTIEADGPDGKQTECFYYAIYEADDPATAGATYRTELETKQRECRATYWN